MLSTAQENRQEADQDRNQEGREERGRMAETGFFVVFFHMRVGRKPSSNL